MASVRFTSLFVLAEAAVTTTTTENISVCISHPLVLVTKITEKASLKEEGCIFGSQAVQRFSPHPGHMVLGSWEHVVGEVLRPWQTGNSVR